MIELEISSASRIGCVRNNNEDMILIKDLFVRNAEYNTNISLTESDRCIIAVADGMGGHKSGEVASQDALHNLQFFFGDLPLGLDASAFNEMMVDWLESINLMIESKGKVDERFKGMGTTLVAIAYYDGEFFSMNCGDSRLYRYRDGMLEQMTSDHSLSTLLGKKQHSNIITNCIGGGCSNSYIDIVQITDDVLNGDTYLLCSDGLTDMVKDEQIKNMLGNSADADELCNEAIACGGLDNVSVCLIHVKKD